VKYFHWNTINVGFPGIVRSADMSVQGTAKLKTRDFLRCFRDLIQVPRIENRVPRIREIHRRVPRIRKKRVPKMREIGSLQVHTGDLTFSFKKNCENR